MGGNCVLQQSKDGAASTDLLQLLMNAKARSGTEKSSADELTAGDEADKFEEDRTTRPTSDHGVTANVKLTDDEIVQTAWIVMLAG